MRLWVKPAMTGDMEVKVLNSFIRTGFLFLTAVALMRVMGKRQMAQLQPYELVLAILMADIASAPMGDPGIPLLYGIIPMLSLVFLHTLLTLLSMKSEKWRRAINGSTNALIKDGRLHAETLDKYGITISDLLEQLRLAGFAKIEDVRSALLETTGQLSVFDTPVPLPVILSGQIQTKQLNTLGRDEAWLCGVLAGAGHGDVGAIALCQADEAGSVVVYKKGASEQAIKLSG